MESSRGNLANHRLSLVMPALFVGQPPAGALWLTRGGVHRTFWVRDGFVIAESSNVPEEHLANQLAKLGVLELSRAAAAFEAAETCGIPFGQYLLDRGFVDRPRLLEALELKAREALFDCYEWEAGDFEFVPGQRPSGGVALELKLGTLHRDALAREREWRTFREVFPDPSIRFDAFPEVAVEWMSDDEQALLELASEGGSLAELLGCGAEGRLAAARRVLRLYHRGALAPQSVSALAVGEVPEAHQLLQRATQAFLRGDFLRAVALAAEALSRAPLPEAQLIYREAEMRLALSIADRVLSLEGRLVFGSLPKALPPGLNADDLYLLAKLRTARSVREAIRGAAMGELAAYRAVERLIASGFVRVRGENEPRATLPYGIPVLA